MKKTIKKIGGVVAATAASALGMTFPVLAADPFCDSLPDDMKAAAGCAQGDTFSGVIQGILSAIIGAGALVAVVYIVIGGVQYMTSNGDAGKVEKGKKTILYALIGLAICALAFAIVNWAIGTINGPAAPATP